MCAVGENIKAAGVSLEFVAGEPDIALLRDETYKQNDHQRSSNAKGRENAEPVSQRI